jgi:succinate dehydrogenase / fumarate reductase cytochrome b subunit
VNILVAFYRSSVGKKMIVAITGIILILFVIGHLLGNLQIFLGPDWINGYSQHLRDLGPLLWLIRLFLLAIVVTHIYVTIIRLAAHGDERSDCARIHHLPSGSFHRSRN